MIQDTTKKHFSRETIDLQAPTFEEAKRFVFIPDGSELAYDEYMGLKSTDTPFTHYEYRKMVVARNKRLERIAQKLHRPTLSRNLLPLYIENETTDTEIEEILKS